MPPFKSAFFGQELDGMKHDSRIGAAGVNTLISSGALSNKGRFDMLALAGAVYCGDVATLDALLRHHVNVAQRAAPNVADALTEATIDGDAPVVQRLLDHGADPCAFDRRAAEFHRKHPARATHTLAQIGSHATLPAALIARLSCPAIAAAH